MTTDNSTNGESTASDGALPKLEQNMARIQDLTARLMAAMANKRDVPKDLQGPAPELYSKATSSYFNDLIHNPSKIIEQQVGYWGKTFQHFVDAQQALASGKLAAPADIRKQ